MSKTIKTRRATVLNKTGASIVDHVACGRAMADGFRKAQAARASLDAEYAAKRERLESAQIAFVRDMVAKYPGMTSETLDAKVKPAFVEAWDGKDAAIQFSKVKVAYLALAGGIEPGDTANNFQKFVNTVARPALAEAGKSIASKGQGRKARPQGDKVDPQTKAVADFVKLFSDKASRKTMFAALQEILAVDPTGKMFALECQDIADKYAEIE